MHKSKIKTLAKTHRWRRARHDHYVEEPWVSERLFAVEEFNGSVYDPFCGFGHVVTSARLHGYTAAGTDIVNRGFGNECRDFFKDPTIWQNIVGNPPFDNSPALYRLALQRCRHKLALVMPVARLNAATWLRDTPLVRVWLLTPRPSMPPGPLYRRYLQKGQRPRGGTIDFCWLVFDKASGYEGRTGWLRREGR